MNTKAIPTVNSLLAKIPSGREIHTVPDYQPPFLEGDALDAMRAPPDDRDDFGHNLSSDDDMVASPPPPAIGAFPGADTGRSPTAQSSNTYF